MNINTIVMAAIGFLIAVVLFGSAMTSFTAQSTAGWGSTIFSIWQLLPILAILAVALLIFGVARRAMSNN